MIETLIIITVCVFVLVIGLGLVIVAFLDVGKTASKTDTVGKKLDEDGYGK